MDADGDPPVRVAQSAGELHHMSDGGVAGTHLGLPAFPVRVAPTTAKEFNRIAPALVPLACWRIDDVRFQFDSSFVGPEIAAEIQALADLRTRHKVDADPAAEGGDPVAVFPRLSIFGHADPVGDDDYNKSLSGRRARAIYALLTRDTTIWETLYSTRIRGAGDPWGSVAIDTMLVHLGFGGGTHEDEVRRFQQSQSLDVDGDAGPKTRAKLFAAYMNKLCGDLTLDKADDFLAGTDAKGKGDVQGCSEFNPLLLFSLAEGEELDKPENQAERNSENAPNRRVLALLFRPGVRVAAAKWPCPRADEGADGCRKRFWSDGERRRTPTDERRLFELTNDTFACRFYHRLTTNSPCERVRKSVEIRLYAPTKAYIANAPCEVAIGGSAPIRRVADGRGILRLVDVEVPNTCDVKWGFPPHGGEEPVLVFSLRMHLLGGGEADEARKKLNNLGYTDDDLATNIRHFQRDYGSGTPSLAATGALDGDTLDRLRTVYRRCADRLDQP
jgi:hypothetical protein